MPAYVIDASVAAKWFLPREKESLVEEALVILRGYAEGRVALLVPDLFWTEFGNLLWKSVKLGRMPRRLAEEALSRLMETALPTSASFALLSDALAIAMTFGRSVYDSVYIALAIAAKRPLLTADERLVNAVGMRFPVRWLGAIE